MNIFTTIVEILKYLKIMDRSYKQESEDTSNIIKIELTHIWCCTIQLEHSYPSNAHVEYL